MKLQKIVSFLDHEFRVEDVPDLSHNGLQVANTGDVKKVCCAVDASLETFEAAAQAGATLVVCHHGMSWGDSLKRITDLNYRRIAFLIRNDIALYACHLPLDAHPRHGNNIQICKGLGLQHIRRFGMYQGEEIGFAGRFARPVRFETLKRRIASLVGRDVMVLPYGKQTVSSLAVVSGAAPEGVEEAGRKGIDVYLTGEPRLTAYHPAREYGVNVVCAGHYATETFGVRAIADLLTRRFKIPAAFIDFETPL
jgi:dinuclear metal center YbgI/SA1388 family protein